MDVVVVVVSQPLHVLAHASKNELHRFAANNCLHCDKGNVFVLLAHLCNVVVVDVVVVSHPLQVLSHSPGTLSHKPWAKMVWHLYNDNLLRLFAQRCAVLVVLVVVVPSKVVVVVVSQPLQVLEQRSRKDSQRSAANNC